MPSPRTVLRAPLLWLLAPAMAGIAIGQSWPCSPRVAGGVAAGSAGLAGIALVFSRRESIFATVTTLLALAGASLGIGYGWQRWRAPPPFEPLPAPREATLDVRVLRRFASEPIRRSVGGMGLIESADPPLIRLAGQRVYFSVTKKRGPEPLVSGAYRLRGVIQDVVIESPQDGFHQMLIAQGVFLELRRGLVLRAIHPPSRTTRWVNRARNAIERILAVGIARHPVEAALERAMFLGEHAAMTEEQRTAFQRSGTFHVFVVAGLHVGVVATTILSALSLARLPKGIALITGLAAIAAYVELTGAGLPAQRTFIMLACLQCSRSFRLPGNSLAALVLAASITLVIDPQELFNPGFQMSYAVVTALVVMGTPLLRRWEIAWRPWSSLPRADWGWLRIAIRDLGRKVLHGAATASVALLASAPCMIGSFGVLSLGSVLANLVVVPLAALSVTAGFWSSLCGLASGELVSGLFNRAAVLTIKTMVALVALGSRVPVASVSAEFRQPWMAPAATVAVVSAMLAGASLRWRRSAGGFWLPVAVFVLVLLFGVKFGGNGAIVRR
ncbi:MAG TPA: ComEC/Rec2 family competence protein [Candidatus Didemnitutus sp.]|nr:ComEC/Rec2 family competence protein [Candidatus Didemnitutus sp.]